MSEIDILLKQINRLLIEHTQLTMTISGYGADQNIKLIWKNKNAKMLYEYLQEQLQEIQENIILENFNI